MMIFLRVKLLFISLWIASAPLFAVEFEVYQSSYNPLNLALLVDAEEENEQQQTLLHDVVAQDLTGSRSFRSLDPLSYLSDVKRTLGNIEYSDWRIIGTDRLALVKLKKTEQGWSANVTLHHPFSSKLVARTKIQQRGHDQVRLLAHRVADYLYHFETGLPSYFTSYILFVQKRGRQSDLMFMSQDGENLQKVGKDFTLLLSPALSPDRTVVAFNSYAGNRSRLEFFNLLDGQRSTFGRFSGLNSTPEFSPDGRFIAATLSYTGNSEIHIYDIKNKKWRQFTHNPAIDTTPTWSPDGKWIAFTSNRSGSPQIYRKALFSGKTHRISLDAKYNTTPSWAPVGDRIAFVTKKGWEYAIATAHIDGTGLRYLATGQRIESPTWSPNGQMVLYSAEENGVKHIYNVPVWGGEVKRITPAGMSASDPVWSR